jgi:Bacterial conjugation TrbI-like protein
MTCRVVGTALLTIMFAGASMSQTGNRTDEPATTVSAAPAITIPLSAGTAINASLVNAVDSSRSKPGDPVTAIVNESVTYQRSVLLPKGSKIVGHVVRTGGDSDNTSALFVEFDRVTLPNGQEAALNAGIQALAPPASAATIPSRKDYEEDRMAGNIGSGPVDQSLAKPGSKSETVVMPSTFTTPHKSTTVAELPPQRIEGGLDRTGRFTVDSKGAFYEPNMRIFTPVSEGSHGTVLVGAKKNVRLEAGTHLLIVIQPPAASPDIR